MLRSNLGLYSATLLLSLTALAAPQGFRQAGGETGGGLRYRLPYTFGTHEGSASVIKGRLDIDLDNPSMTKGNLWVSLDSLLSDSAERDCHMREALGLDYALSAYPEEHVCSGDNKLPSSGKDAVAYPDIALKITSVKSQDDSGNIRRDAPTGIEVTGSWSLHGVTRPARFPLRVFPEGGKFRVKGEIPFSLQSHGIEVKTVDLFLVVVRVEDAATLSFDLLLEAI